MKAPGIVHVRRLGIAVLTALFVVASLLSKDPEDKEPYP